MLKYTVFFVSLFVFLSTPLCIAFEVDPWYNDLQQFGPTKTDGWNARPMELIADHTFRISGLDVRNGDEFMFVAKLTDPAPPLGILDFKQGKIGVGSVLDAFPGDTSDVNDDGDGGIQDASRQGNVYTGKAKLEAGGGSGRYPLSGICTLTVNTREMSLEWSIEADGPTAKLSLGTTAEKNSPPREVSTSNFRFVRAIFSEPAVPPTFPEGKTLKDFFELSNVRIASEITVSQDADPETNEKVLTYLFEVEAIRAGSISEVAALPGAAVSSRNGASLSTRSRKVSFLWTHNVRKGAKWGALVTLRDESEGTSAPSGGWYVTPIHSNYIPSLGKVLFTGWIRRDGMPCRGGPFPGGRRRAGVSFLLDPLKLPMTSSSSSSSSSSSTNLVVDSVDEENEYSFFEEREPPVLYGANDQVLGGDVLYCSGHTTLQDGRVFYTGGARYSHISGGDEYEWGLDYARIFDPETGKFTRVKERMPLGTSWYPTNGRLPDGRVMVTGAFSAFATSECLGPTCYNPRIDIFDPKKLESGENPWEVYIDKEHADHAIDPGIKEYTRVFVLPEPVVRDGISREILLMGKAGAIIYAALGDVPMSKRLYHEHATERPGNCYAHSDESTAIPVVQRGGELIVAGGCTGDGDTMQRIDVFSVKTASWRSYDTGIRRGTPASLWLPDGTIMILSGANGDNDQNALAENVGHEVTPRHPVVFDPETGVVSVEIAGEGGVWDNDPAVDVFRGYHNTLALLGDGSIVVGGGLNQHGDVGCENPNMRLFKPSYLSRGPRPVISRNSMPKAFKVKPGEKRVPIVISRRVRLHESRPASLVAVQALTHSYGQNNRYIPLAVDNGDDDDDGNNDDDDDDEKKKKKKKKKGALVINDEDDEKESNDDDDLGVIYVDIPDEPITMKGQYHLFILSDKGVPSESIHVIVGDDSNAETVVLPSNSKEKGIKKVWAEHKAIVIGAASAIVLIAFGLGVALRMRSSRRARDGTAHKPLADLNDL